MSEERVKRKLSAILSADVVGYSRLMGEDEVSTVRTLEAYRKVMSDLIEQFRGRVVDSPGDNLLSEFSSVVDAVQCAVEIHDVIRAKNEDLPEDRRMLFRIGVNLGDVIEEGDRIYGDGVNIAARLEGLAEAGGICISGSAHEQIENKLALGYEFLGEHTVKNIAKPVKVYKVPVGPKVAFPKEGDEKGATLRQWRWTALSAAGAVIVIIGTLAIWNFYLRQAPVVSDVEEAPKTIAVLPFDDLSPEKDQEHFVLGLSEEILNSLTQIPDLTVKARTSSFSFKGQNKTIQEIAKILGVDHVLEGSVRKYGNALRITAQLIKTDNESHLWSDTYDKDLDIKEIYAVQEDIANSVADKLKLTLDAFKLLGGTENIKAYEKYLVTKAIMNNLFEQLQRGEGTIELINRAQKSLETAITLDPEFALAWTYKAPVQWCNMAFTGGYSVESELDSGLDGALNAINLEPDLPEAHYSLGLSRLLRGEFIDAELAYKRARELSDDPIICTSFGLPVHYLAVDNYGETKKILDASQQRDPLNQTIYGLQILTSGLLGNMQRAEKKYVSSTTLFNAPPAGSDFFITILRLGSKNVALRDEILQSDLIWDTVKEHLDSPDEGLMKLRRIYTNEQNLTSTHYLEMTVCAAYFGDPELSMEILEKSVAMNPTYFMYTSMPVFRKVRQLPQFKVLVKKFGLVDYWKKFGWPDICRPVGDDDFVCD